MVGKRRDLRQMRDAQNLSALRDLQQLFRHLLCGAAGNARVHLVEDHGGNGVLLGHYVFNGQHDTGKLAARGDLAQGLEGLADVRAHQKPKRVCPAGAQRNLGKLADKPDLGHVERFKLLADARFHTACSLHTEGVQRVCSRLCLLLGCFQALFCLRKLFVGKDDVVQLLPRFGKIRQHRVAVGPVFALELVDQIQPRADLVQLVFRIGKAVAVGSQLLGYVHQIIADLLQLVKQAGNGIVQPCRAAQSVKRLLKRTDGAVALFVAKQIVHGEVEALHKLFGVDQDLLSGLQAFVLAAFQIRLFQFVDLILQCLLPAELFGLIH